MIKRVLFSIVLGGLLSPLISFADENDQHPCQKMHASERKLEVAFDRISTKYADNQNFLDKFNASQGAWAKYKNAQIAARFPNDTDDSFDPNVPPECRCKAIDDMIVARLNEMGRWLDGTEERGSCSE